MNYILRWMEYNFLRFLFDMHRFCISRFLHISVISLKQCNDVNAMCEDIEAENLFHFEPDSDCK